MIVRKVTKQDRAAITGILNDIIAIGGTTAFEEPLEPGYFDRFITPPDPMHFMCVAETDEGVVGLQWMEPLAPPKAHLGGIATFAKPGTVQRGIGSALFKATLSECQALGYSGIEAKIRADNTGGLTYYSKMGFVDHCVTEAVPLRDGTPVDRIHKRFKLLKQTSTTAQRS